MKGMVFIDSGAFSVFNRGTTINLQEYENFLQRFKKDIIIYANLDVIGVKESFIGTEKNQKILESKKLSPLPIYHSDEPIKVLFKLMDKYEYIGIGAGKVRSIDARVKRYDTLFDKITDKKGKPIVKVHGFGITRPDFMIRYPFTSCDSSTWIKTPAYGSLMVPSWNAYKVDFDYTINYTVYLGVDRKNPTHLCNMNSSVKKYVNDFIEYCGYTLEGSMDILKDGKVIESRYEVRQQLNLFYYEGLREQLSTKQEHVFRKDVIIKSIF